MYLQERIMIDTSEISLTPPVSSQEESYSIPADVDKKIPCEFYEMMHNELLRVLEIDWIKELQASNYGYEETYYDLRSSSPAWRAAFYNACYLTYSMWLYTYWDGLDWESQDDFDSILEDRIIELFAE